MLNDEFGKYDNDDDQYANDDDYDDDEDDDDDKNVLTEDVNLHTGRESWDEVAVEGRAGYNGALEDRHQHGDCDDFDDDDDCDDYYDDDYCGA